MLGFLGTGAEDVSGRVILRIQVSFGDRVRVSVGFRVSSRVRMMIKVRVSVRL